ncbi:PEP-CTERM sorting domain-containing protein [Lacipirellula sp.]|uniref:PEP-CTERM sorting domain-containing protein n=1 Tax=Lacipirellula sp. TaxID=2691419 RepID=UPI003D145CD3
MKRGLAFALCAALVGATASPAFAAVNVQLNLRYTNPANPTGGGSWDLLVQSTGAQGLAGASFTIGGNLGVTGIDTPLAAITPNAAVFNNTTSVFKFQGTAASTTITLGDDFAGAKILNVGKGAGTPGNVAADDLFPTNSVFWDNSALLASGSWTGARPTLVGAGVSVNEFDGTGTALVGTVGTVSVRGDSVGVDGLKLGDVNRDGLVNVNDFGGLSSNYLQPGVKTWDQGDFNSDGTVNVNDFGALSSNYNSAIVPPRPISAVPEPTSIAMLGVALLGLGAFAKRK